MIKIMFFNIYIRQINVPEKFVGQSVSLTKAKNFARETCKRYHCSEWRIEYKLTLLKQTKKKEIV